MSLKSCAINRSYWSSRHEFSELITFWWEFWWVLLGEQRPQQAQVNFSMFLHIHTAEMKRIQNVQKFWWKCGVVEAADSSLNLLIRLNPNVTDSKWIAEHEGRKPRGVGKFWTSLSSAKRKEIDNNIRVRRTAFALISASKLLLPYSKRGEKA